MSKPDILDCLANLSSDEVFTPPKLANEMLDLLPRSLWRNPKARFCDPFTKSGVFLREIVKRLDAGLAETFPDKDERIRHILGHQVYGVAITRLTALLARRTLYCNKDAHGPSAAIQRLFRDDSGLVAYSRSTHRWKNGACEICGASEKAWGAKRSADVENYAYPFLHDKRIIKMAEELGFDVVIGNPPYQMKDGGGTGSSAIPIYHRFVQQAKKLNPKFLVMIIPSRWMTGGKGLDEFRKEMLADRHVRVLHDFINAKECFPDINLEGGVCYFKMDFKNEGTCQIFTHQADGTVTSSTRYLDSGASDIVIRDAKVMGILDKVKGNAEISFSTIVSRRNPFGIIGKVDNYVTELSTHRQILCRYDNKRQWLNLKDSVNLKKNSALIGKYKLFVSKADGAAGQLGNPIPARIIGKAELGGPNQICSETFLCIASRSKSEALNIAHYMTTKFFRFMVGIRKNKNMTSDTYSFVPVQDFSKPWTDEELYAKYGLDGKEIAFIESMIRPMEGGR